MGNKDKGSFKINLLIHKGESIKLEVRLLRWLLSSGRFIVILVEIVVISAFIARYKFDADLSNIQEKIQEQIPYVQSLKSDEQLIRQTQFQLSNIKKIKTENPDYTQTILKISEHTPKNIQISSIALEQTTEFSVVSLIISGKTTTTKDLSAFIKALKEDPIFGKITLTNISFEEESSFTITGEVKVKGVKS